MQAGDNPVIFAVYDENQRPDEFSFSDSIEGDALCLQPSVYVIIYIQLLRFSIKRFHLDIHLFMRFHMKTYIQLYY